MESFHLSPEWKLACEKMAAHYRFDIDDMLEKIQEAFADKSFKTVFNKDDLVEACFNPASSEIQVRQLHSISITEIDEDYFKNDEDYHDHGLQVEKKLFLVTQTSLKHIQDEGVSCVPWIELGIGEQAGLIIPCCDKWQHSISENPGTYAEKKFTANGTVIVKSKTQGSQARLALEEATIKQEEKVIERKKDLIKQKESLLSEKQVLMVEEEALMKRKLAASTSFQGYDGSSKKRKTTH